MSLRLSSSLYSSSKRILSTCSSSSFSALSSLSSISISSFSHFPSSSSLSSFSSSSICPRYFSSSINFPLSVKVARYDKTGPAEQCIKIIGEEIPSIGDNDILIKFLAAPINPADINMIEGVYSIKPPLPAVGGNEGVAEIIKKGKNVPNDLSIGDWVIPAQPGFGTWRSYAAVHFDTVDKIANDIPAESAATCAINPCTAYRLLHDFVSLKPGDIVIQTGGNSTVGVSVIQLAKYYGWRTINIVRDRPNISELIDKLKGLGADLVVTEEQLAGKNMKDLLVANNMAMDQIKLGLNCVGGSAASEMSRWLSDHSPLVTYGGMSKRPVNVPTGRLIFNDIIVRGFWLSRWTMTKSKEERKQMLNTITDLIRQKKLIAFIEKHSFDSFDQALTKAVQGYKENKIVLTFDK